MERTLRGSFDLLVAEAKDFSCVSVRLAAQGVGIVRETANHMSQFMQEDRYLRGGRVSEIRAD